MSGGSDYDPHSKDAMFAMILAEMKGIRGEIKSTQEHFTGRMDKQDTMILANTKTLEHQDGVLREIKSQTAATAATLTGATTDISALKTDIDSIKTWKRGIKMQIGAIAGAASGVVLLIKEGILSIHHP